MYCCIWVKVDSQQLKQYEENLMGDKPLSESLRIKFYDDIWRHLATVSVHQPFILCTFCIPDSMCRIHCQVPVQPF